MRVLVVAAFACTTPKPVAEPVLAQCGDIAVVDEAGAPVVGARVQVQHRRRSCGPSALPEGCVDDVSDAPALTTDATGVVTSCGPADTISVTYRDWPRAHVAAARTITIGPPRTAFVEVPGCAEARVVAYGNGEVHGTPVGDGRFALAGLGPWQYTVRNTGACPAFARIIDVRHMPALITLDASDTHLAFPALAGATATLREFRDATPVVMTTLDAGGDATVQVPGGAAHTYCLRLETPTACLVTFARAGEIARPLLWLGREREVEAQCGRCE